MNKPRQHRFRIAPGTILGVLALLVAGTMPAEAALSRIAAGSVGTAQLKNSAVTSPKIANGTIRPVDLAPAAKPRLPRVRLAVMDEWKDLTPNQRSYLTITLPAGRWAITAKGHESNMGSSTPRWCSLLSEGKSLDFSDSVSASDTYVRHGIVLEGVVATSAFQQVSIACSGSGNFGFAKILAIEVH